MSRANKRALWGHGESIPAIEFRGPHFIQTTLGVAKGRNGLRQSERMLEVLFVLEICEIRLAWAVLMIKKTLARRLTLSSASRRHLAARRKPP